MDQNEKQLEKKLRDRIEANYRSYIQQLQSKPAADLIEQASEIAAVTLVCDELMGCCNPGEAEYLLRFEDPLRLVSDQWLAEQNVSHSDELGHVLLQGAQGAGVGGAGRFALLQEPVPVARPVALEQLGPAGPRLELLDRFEGRHHAFPLHVDAEVRRLTTMLFGSNVVRRRTRAS